MVECIGILRSIVVSPDLLAHLISIFPLAQFSSFFPHLSASMSVYIEGTAVSSFGFSPVSATVVSRALADSFGISSGRSALVTVIVPVYGAFSTSVVVRVQDDAPYPLLLAFDWSASLRESLIFMGHAIGSGFDAWTFLTDPGHPLTGCCKFLALLVSFLLTFNITAAVSSSSTPTSVIGMSYLCCMVIAD
jgi:hypothetical protein